MILTTHALVGAALGKQIHNPFIVAPLAIALHFCLDTFRHGEYLNKNTKFKTAVWRVLADLFSALIILFIFLRFSHASYETTRNIFIGTFFSMFPDLLTLLYWKLHLSFLEKIFHFHEWVHPYPKGDKRYAWNLRNNLNDIIFSIIAISILLFL
jgi:hypothetical protein